jgi:hypothetical protein
MAISEAPVIEHVREQVGLGLAPREQKPDEEV